MIFSLYGSNKRTADTRSKVKVKCVTEQLQRSSVENHIRDTWSDTGT